MEKAAKYDGIMVVHAEDDDIVQFNYEKFREEGRTEGANLHLVHNKLSEQLAFRRTIGVAAATGAAVYFLHTSARDGVCAGVVAPAHRLPTYSASQRPHARLSAERFKEPSRVHVH